LPFLIPPVKLFLKIKTFLKNQYQRTVMIVFLSIYFFMERYFFTIYYRSGIHFTNKFIKINHSEETYITFCKERRISYDQTRRTVIE